MDERIQEAIDMFLAKLEQVMTSPVERLEYLRELSYNPVASDELFKLKQEKVVLVERNKLLEEEKRSFQRKAIDAKKKYKDLSRKLNELEKVTKENYELNGLINDLSSQVSSLTGRRLKKDVLIQARKDIKEDDWF